MGINSDQIVDEIEVPVTFPHLYKDEQGQPVTFLFTLRLATDGESDADEAAEAQATDLHALRVKQLAQLIITRPQGFNDFPALPDGMTEDTESAEFLRWLRKEARQFFAAKKWRHVIRYVMAFYDNAALPSELFRSL
jgi:hypothetical protein